MVQCREEILPILARVPAARLWHAPNGAASIGFHVRHLAGSADRLLTYAAGRQLDPAQLAALAAEKVPDESITADALARVLEDAVESTLAAYRAAEGAELGAPREVGRARAASTLLGVLSHVAEHSTRHTGQIVATARILGI